MQQRKILFLNFSATFTTLQRKLQLIKQINKVTVILCRVHCLNVTSTNNTSHLIWIGLFKDFLTLLSSVDHLEQYFVTIKYVWFICSLIDYFFFFSCIRCSDVLSAALVSCLVNINAWRNIFLLGKIPRAFGLPWVGQKLTRYSFRAQNFQEK